MMSKILLAAGLTVLSTATQTVTFTCQTAQATDVVWGYFVRQGNIGTNDFFGRCTGGGTTAGTASVASLNGTAPVGTTVTAGSIAVTSAQSITAVNAYGASLVGTTTAATCPNVNYCFATGTAAQTITVNHVVSTATAGPVFGIMDCRQTTATTFPITLTQSTTSVGTTTAVCSRTTDSTVSYATFGGQYTGTSAFTIPTGFLVLPYIPAGTVSFGMMTAGNGVADATSLVAVGGPGTAPGTPTVAPSSNCTGTQPCVVQLGVLGSAASTGTAGANYGSYRINMISAANATPSGPIAPVVPGVPVPGGVIVGCTAVCRVFGNLSAATYCAGGMQMLNGNATASTACANGAVGTQISGSCNTGVNGSTGTNTFLCLPPASALGNNLRFAELAAIVDASTEAQYTALIAAFVAAGYGTSSSNTCIGACRPGTLDNSRGIVTCRSCTGLRQLADARAGRALVVCTQATSAERIACLREAACRNAYNPAAATCTNNAVVITCPRCSSRSKKGLLGLLGLLGIIPLVLLSLSSSLLLCCRRRKTLPEQQFATFDPLAMPVAEPTVCTASAPVYGAMPGTVLGGAYPTL